MVKNNRKRKQESSDDDGSDIDFKSKSNKVCIEWEDSPPFIP